jgi:Sulfotransferase domain
VSGDASDAAAGVAGSAPGSRPVPEFFIVGHQKCGTTALYMMLRGHPQVFMPDVKEPRFFATDQRSRLVAEPPGRRPRTLEAYLDLFTEAQPGQRVGEASPQYLRSSVAAEGIAELQPDARIIAILREPASFLRSFQMQMVSSKVETEVDLAKALALEPQRREGKHIPSGSHHPEALLYSDHVRYVEQLKRFYAVLPPENILVLIYEDYLRANAETVRRVLGFLDLDQTVEIEPVQTTALKSVRSRRLHDLAGVARRAQKNPAGVGRAGRAFNAMLPGAMRSATFKRLWRSVAYSEQTPPDASLMLELRRRYKDEVVALGEFLDRDMVALWGYDKIV